MNTAARMHAIATTGPDTSSIAWTVASRGLMPRSILCCTASTTTIASSTTMPIASTSPNMLVMLMEKPRSGNSANVPMMDTGTASSGISVARQFWRKTKTTRTTSAIASNNVTTTSAIEVLTYRVASKPTRYSSPAGNRVCASSSSFLTRSAVSTAFAPGER